MERQQRLSGPDALELWGVIDEPALHRQVSGTPR
ncbi:hypothetical protein [Microbispora amethystogenes]